MRVPRPAAVVLTVVATAVVLSSCATGPSTRSELCDGFDTLGEQVLGGSDGFSDNEVFRRADDLADLAERYPDSDVAGEAESLHEIADADSTSGSALMEATGQIANTCGHPLGFGSFDGSRS